MTTHIFALYSVCRHGIFVYYTFSVYVFWVGFSLSPTLLALFLAGFLFTWIGPLCNRQFQRPIFP